MYIYVASSGDQLRLLNRLGNENAQVNVQSTDKFYDSKTAVPQEKWFCYEWHVTSSESHVFMDGKELTSAKGPGANNPTGIYLGFQRFQSGGTAGDISIDDVALNNTQIGCQ